MMVVEPTAWSIWIDICLAGGGWRLQLGAIFCFFYGKDAIYTIDYSEIVWLVLYCVQDVIDNIGAW